MWHYWTTFLKTLTMLNSRRLKTSLGKWISPVTDIRRQYTTYRHEVYNIISKQIQEIQQLPTWVVPCKITFNQVFPNTFPRDRHVIVETKLPEVVQTQSYSQNIIVVTDASVHQNQAAIAWVITDSQGEILHKFKQQLQENGISSFRAEAYGVCSALTTLHSSQTIQYSRWKLCCDNKALIHRLLSLQQKKFNLEWIDSDILKVISDHIPPNGSFHHVKGHQVITEQSPLEARLNDFVDKLANLAIQEVPQEFNYSNTWR
jgi:Reverse transcriptase-like